MDYTDNDLIKSNIVSDADNEHSVWYHVLEFLDCNFCIALNSTGVQDNEVAWFQASAVV
jgi:hypothetical protein